MSDPANGPLRGVNVLDLGAMIAGPATATILADQGANVIKVEPAGMGDVMRYMGAMRNGVSALFHNSNRGKRSLALDLKSPSSQAIIHKLVEWADVVVHNFRAGAAERLGIDYDSLKVVNPELIYLWVNGFGDRGPMLGNAAYDSVIQAFAGVSQSQSDLETGEPCQYFQLFSDKLTALNGAQAITAALFARAQGRGGQRINLSMVETVVGFLWIDASGVTSFVDEGAESGMEITRNRLTQFKDGWGAVAPVTDAQFHGFCRAFGIDSSASELATAMDRNQHPELVTQTIRQVVTTVLEVSLEEAVRRLDEADVPFAPALNLADLPNHPQLQATGTFHQTEHPVAGRMIEPGNAPRFSATPSGVGCSSPMLGEHTQPILEELGFAREVITELFSDKVVS